MATRSTITLATNDGNYKRIYCHWDGDQVGGILREHFNTYEKVEALIALGDLSSLGEHLTPEPGQEHDFDKPQPNVCVFYGRDRGEEDTEARTFSTTFEIRQKSGLEERNYIFVENVWKSLD